MASGTTQHGKLTVKQKMKKLFFIVLGAIIVAFALETFFVPAGIIDGGVTGIALILNKITGWSLGIFLLALNIPFILLGYKQIGMSFALSSVIGVSVMSLGTVLIPHGHVTTDPLISSVFGGGILGLGVGLVLRSNATTDGSETVAILISRKSALSVGEIVLIINVFILLSGGLVFGWTKALYSIIAYYIAVKVIDMVMNGFQENKAIWIISDQSRELGQAIIDRLGRSVTYLSGEGAYSGEDKNMIYVVVTRLEEAKLLEIVDSIDKQAFLTVGSVSEVRGGRFKKKDIH